jgi:hypothetical protein
MSVVPLEGTQGEVLFIGIREEAVPAVQEMIRANGVDLSQFAGSTGLVSQAREAAGNGTPTRDWEPAVDELFGAIDLAKEAVVETRDPYKQIGQFTVANIAVVLPNASWSPIHKRSGTFANPNGASRYLFLSGSELKALAQPNKKDFKVRTSDQRAYSGNISELAVGLRLREPDQSDAVPYTALTQEEIMRRTRDRFYF